MFPVPVFAGENRNGLAPERNPRGILYICDT